VEDVPYTLPYENQSCDNFGRYRNCHRGTKFTNIHPKRGISVNLPQLCDVGLPGRKAGLGFNRFKEPVAQQMRT
jgi:hypothetical protein